MTSRSVHRKRILVVDDEPAIGKICQRVLTNKGFEVDIAPDGRTAQAMISKQEYDLYLVDIRLPVMNGEEFYEWLEEEYPHSVSRVLFMTGSMIGQDTESFLKRSGRPVLPKPFTPDELKEMVNACL